MTLKSLSRWCRTGLSSVLWACTKPPRSRALREYEREVERCQRQKRKTVPAKRRLIAAKCAELKWELAR